jgi:1-acyl-sn-glycerol-3-phosphate acyltransferase
MAGKVSTKKPRAKSAGGGKKRAAPRNVKSALGNDPFVRGAAERVNPALAALPTAAATAVPGGGAFGAGSLREEPPASKLQIGGSAPELPTATPTSDSAPTSSAPTQTSTLRSRLDTLEHKVERELGHAAEAASGAAARLADLAREEASGEHARDLFATVAGMLPGLRERLAGLASLGRLFEGPGELDFFGMDRELVASTAGLLDFLYGSWWRVSVRRIETVPAQGPVVVVANHGGALPWDALVLRLALQRDHPVRRELRPLLDEHALKMPLVGGLATRLGAVAATPENALHLLGEGRVVAVFPEGSRVARRPWPDRYKVQRFGRGGFAKLALRTGAPIVPCAIVGSEESSAPFSRAGWLAERLGLPAALAPTLPLGLLALFPLPSRWSVRFGEPIDTASLGAAAADDPARVLELTERARSSLQEMLDRDVAARRSVYL